MPNEVYDLLNSMEKIKFVNDRSGIKPNLNLSNVNGGNEFIQKVIANIVQPDYSYVFPAAIWVNGNRECMAIWYVPINSFILIRMEDINIWTISVISKFKVKSKLPSALSNSTSDFFQKDICYEKYYYEEYEGSDKKNFTIWLDDTYKVYSSMVCLVDFFDSKIPK